MLEVLPSSCLHLLQNEKELEAAGEKYIESVNHTPFVGQLIRTLTVCIFMSTIGRNMLRSRAAESSENTQKTTQTKSI